MCTVVILRRPGHDWPLILAANRDEMTGRPWLPPARHWPDQAEIIAGQDELAGGTWLGLNDWGVIAGILNRPGTLGPDAHRRSRGELPLDALDHAEATVAAEAMAAVNASSYRPFNLILADAGQAFWVKSEGHGNATAAAIPDGVSILTAHDLNDTSSPRIRRFLPLFEAAAAPDVEADDWTAWQAIIGETGGDAPLTFTADESDPPDTPQGGFATVSSSLLALPALGRQGIKAKWLFAPAHPDRTPYAAVEI